MCLKPLQHSGVDLLEMVKLYLKDGSEIVICH